MFKAIVLFVIVLSVITEISAKQIAKCNKEPQDEDYEKEPELNEKSNDDDNNKYLNNPRVVPDYSDWYPIYPPFGINQPIKFLKTLVKLDFCPDIYSENEDKNNKTKSIRRLQRNLLKSYQSMAVDVDIWTHTYLDENDFESFDDLMKKVLNLTFENLNKNRTVKDESLATKINQLNLKKSDKPISIQGICDFLNDLQQYVEQCNKEHNCEFQLNEEDTEKYEKLLKRRSHFRFGNDHNVLAQAVKDFAEKLEAVARPEDEAMILLANAVHNLFNDITILHENTTPANHWNVIISILNVWVKMDQCSRDTQCRSDWYYIFGAEKRSGKKFRAIKKTNITK